MSVLLRYIPAIEKFESLCGRLISHYIPFDVEFTVLFAVPKQKVSHSRKRIRMASKQLKNLQNISNCSKCGQPKLQHSLCWSCYGDFKKSIKSDCQTSSV